MKVAIHKLTGLLLNRPMGIAAILNYSLLTFPAVAETVTVKLPTGISASANFKSGLPSLPAVLLLHGFQQTHRSEPINSLASHLAAKGYTVLNPTMSLGVNYRSQSMPCEAVHTQTIDEEVAEISYWTNWLSDKGTDNIILASFSSTGNIGMLLYTSQAPNLNIKKAILIAPNPPIVDQKEKRKIIASLKSRAQKDEQNLGIFTLSYCKNNYATTTDSYLSYAKYDSKEFIELIKNSQVHTELIIGSADTVMTPSWATQLKSLSSPVRITMVDKAGHFFDGPSEFDLADIVENILKN